MALHRLLFLLLTIITFSCNKTKDEELVTREEQLLLREKEFAEKEEEYKQLLKLRDSLYVADSIKDAYVYKIATWPDSLSGEWNSRMVCRETTCKTYVIGDQRNERWVFSSDSLGLMVNVMDNNKLKRRLKADLTDGNVTLKLPADSLSTKKIGIDANLNEFSNKLIKGTHTITAADGCTARFSVELTPVVKK